MPFWLSQCIDAVSIVQNISSCITVCMGRQSPKCAVNHKVLLIASYYVVRFYVFQTTAGLQWKQIKVP